jgi:hypothetical protein
LYCAGGRGERGDVERRRRARPRARLRAGGSAGHVGWIHGVTHGGTRRKEFTLVLVLVLVLVLELELTARGPLRRAASSETS